MAPGLLGNGVWKEYFVGEGAALWSAATHLGAGFGLFSGMTFSDDGRSLAASGFYTFDLAVSEFFAVGRWCPP